MSFVVQSVKNVKQFIKIADIVEGKKIANMCIERIDEDTDVICISFTDTSYLSIYDAGGQCCEERYTTTDDDMSLAIGHTLKDIVVLDHTERHNYSGDVHEIQFLEIVVSSPILSLSGRFVFTTHNKHNGYYEGFELLIEYHSGLTI